MQHYYYGELSIKECMCMTAEKDGELDGAGTGASVVLVGACICPYGCGFSKDVPHWISLQYHPLPWNVSELNEAMCGRLNRHGRLCSKCIEGYSPLAYSYDYNCIKCTGSRWSNWLKFIAVAFIPLTIFYFIVVLFRINATNPYMYAFITLNQALGSPVNVRSIFISTTGGYKLSMRLMAILYCVWNLDFFRSLPLNICINLTTLQTLALDYAIAIYPLLLVVITYILIELHARGCRLVFWLWRPFHRCCVQFTRIMDIRSSIIKAFATFLLLSYVKLLNSTTDMLSPVKVKNVLGDNAGVFVYFDASYQYFGKEHLPYVLIAITVFIVFIFSPTILLLVYPSACFQRCLNHYQIRFHAFQVFADTFQGHYKNGTEPGTNDYRWFAAVYFLGRIFVFCFIFVITEDAVCYTLTGFSLIVLAMLMIALKPYKSNKINICHTVLPLCMTLFCFSATLLHQSEIEDVRFTYVAVTLIIFFGLLPTFLAVIFITYFVILRCLRKRHLVLEERY